MCYSSLNVLVQYLNKQKRYYHKGKLCKQSLTSTLNVTINIIETACLKKGRLKFET